VSSQGEVNLHAEKNLVLHDSYGRLTKVIGVVSRVSAGTEINCPQLAVGIVRINVALHTWVSAIKYSLITL
jgi:hypothetical protein